MAYLSTVNGLHIDVVRTLLVAEAAVVAGVYFAIKKIKEKKAAKANDEECYVSCSCCEAEA